MPYFFLGKNYLSQSPTHVGNYYGGTLSTVLAKISWCFLFFRLHNPQLLNPPSIKGNFIDKKSKFPLRQIEAKITLDVRPKKKFSALGGPEIKKKSPPTFLPISLGSQKVSRSQIGIFTCVRFLGQVRNFHGFLG